MKVIVILMCLAFHTCALQRTIERSTLGLSCRRTNTAMLIGQLKSLGGFNREIVAFDRFSARQNLNRAVRSRRPNWHWKANRKGRLNGFKHALEESNIRQDYDENRFEADLKVMKSAYQSRCWNKGSITKAGNLNLCKKCMVTTHLPTDRFPRYITETVCSNTDRTTLTGEGACVTRSISMLFLKRSNLCVLQPDGTYLEKWDSYRQNVAVGCECEIRRGSYLTPIIR